jgi:uncharacterized membrane protein
MSIWHLYNLRESPFFQEQLTADPDARYPTDLFVGRQEEVHRLATGVRQKIASSSRQTVQGPPGYGKSTLVQQVKAVLGEDRVLSYPRAVSVGHADNTQTVLLRIVQYVYATILGSASSAAIADRGPMATAKQLTLAFQTRSGGGGFNVAGALGLNLNMATQFVTPPAALEILVPELLRDLSDLARKQLDAHGILVHLDNLENLSDEDAEAAGRVMRDLRDPVLMTQGYHFVLVGTNEAVRTVVASTRQVRDVFSLPKPLHPLSFPEVVQMLGRRYEHLRADSSRLAQTPVTDEAVADLHALFGGNLRGLLLALEDASRTLIEYGTAGGRPMSRGQVRSVLRGRYLEDISANLDPTDARYLRQIAGAGHSGTYTQATLERVWKVSRGTVSKVLKRLEAAGYVAELEPGEPVGRGRPEKGYQLAAVPRLAYEPVPE